MLKTNLLEYHFLVLQSFDRMFKRLVSWGAWSEEHPYHERIEEAIAGNRHNWFVPFMSILKVT